jgi:hypothetical protein
MNISKLIPWVIVFFIVFLLNLLFPVSLVMGVTGMCVVVIGAIITIILAIDSDLSFVFAAMMKLDLIVIVNIFISDIIRYTIIE